MQRRGDEASRVNNGEMEMPLMTQDAALAAATSYPVAVRVNARGGHREDVCRSPDEVRTLLREAGFRNSIDDVEVERIG